MDKITIKESTFDQDCGYAYVVTGDNLLTQCCLEQRKDRNGYRKVISISCSGYEYGSCRDHNNQL